MSVAKSLPSKNMKCWESHGNASRTIKILREKIFFWSPNHMINSEYLKILKPGISRETYSLSSSGSGMWKKYVVLDEKGSRWGDFSAYIRGAGIRWRLSYTHLPPFSFPPTPIIHVECRASVGWVYWCITNQGWESAGNLFSCRTFLSNLKVGKHDPWIWNHHWFIIHCEVNKQVGSITAYNGREKDLQRYFLAAR